MKLSGIIYADNQLTETIFHWIEYVDPPYQFEALGHQFNGINYTFSHWETNPPQALQNPYNRYQQTSETEHLDYVAHFTGKPTQVQNVRNVGSLNMPIHLVWDVHPNTARYPLTLQYLLH